MARSRADPRPQNRPGASRVSRDNTGDTEKGHKGTPVSARNWRVVTDWTTPGPETYDPRGLEETPPGSRTVIIDQQGGLHELTAPDDPAPDSNPRTFLEYDEVATCPACGADMRGTEEKGVDLRMATDMIRLAWSDNYDIAVLVSSDQDFVPVAEFL